MTKKAVEKRPRQEEFSTDAAFDFGDLFNSVSPDVEAFPSLSWKDWDDDC